MGRDKMRTVRLENFSGHPSTKLARLKKTPFIMHRKLGLGLGLGLDLDRAEMLWPGLARNKITFDGFTEDQRRYKYNKKLVNDAKQFYDGSHKPCAFSLTG